MKTLVFIPLIICFYSIYGLTQNRIHGWEIEKITSIQVELISPANETETLTFITKQDIDAIISFLKKVEFRELNGNIINTEEQENNWSCKIIFQGQRDLVYLYKKSACIGKTSFIIDSNVIEEFMKKVRELLINE
jgi:hypothetical protein